MDITFKIALVDPENKPLQTDSFFRTLGAYFESRYYSVKSPSKNIGFGIDLWQLNLDYLKASSSLFSDNIQGSQMNGVLINSDNFGTGDYEKLCVQTIRKIEDLCKSKPTIIMWGSTCNQIRDFDIEKYQVVHEKNQDDALDSAFKLALGKNISVPPEELHFTRLYRNILLDGEDERFDPLELQQEREMITKRCPSITTSGENYQLFVDPALLGFRYRGKRKIILETSPRGISCLYDQEKKDKKIFVCLKTYPDGNAIFLRDNKPYSVSTGGSIALSIARGTLKKSARTGYEPDKCALMHVKYAIQKLLEK